MSDEPLTHIRRTPLPWRETHKTVCGRPVSQYPDDLVVTLEQAKAMQRRLGQQRFALAICMTCAHNVGHWVRWDDDPLGRMQREVTGGGFGKVEPEIVNELRAIALLIDAHREEFDGLVADFAGGGITTMAQLRQKRAQRRTS